MHSRLEPETPNPPSQNWSMNFLKMKANFCEDKLKYFLGSENYEGKIQGILQR